MITFLLSPLGRLAMAGLMGAIIGFGGAWKIQGYRLESVKTAFEAFKAQVKAQGEEAEKAARKADLDNRKAKEVANREYAKVKTDLASTYAAYRKLLNSPPGGSLPQAAPVTSGTDRTCFDSAQLARAMGVLEAGVPNITEQGDASKSRLIGAMKWAESLSKP